MLSLLYFYGCMCYPYFAGIPIQITCVCFIFCRLGYLGLESHQQVATSEHAELTVTCHWFCWSPSTLRKVFYINQPKNDLCHMPYHITCTKVPVGWGGWGLKSVLPPAHYDDGCVSQKCVFFLSFSCTEVVHFKICMGCPLY